MKTFNKCIVYQHQKLHTWKKLSPATQREIKTALKKQGIMDYKRITITRGGKKIQKSHIHFDI